MGGLVETVSAGWSTGLFALCSAAPRPAEERRFSGLSGFPLPGKPLWSGDPDSAISATAWSVRAAGAEPGRFACSGALRDRPACAAAEPPLTRPDATRRAMEAATAAFAEPSRDTHSKEYVT